MGCFDIQSRPDFGSGCGKVIASNSRSRLGSLFHFSNSYRVRRQSSFDSEVHRAEDEDVKKELASKFIRGGKIHLCLSRPCVETRPLDALHVTKVRVWSWPSFKGTDYLNRGIDRTVKRWLSEGAGRPTGETPPRASSVMKRPSRNDSKKKVSGPPKAADGKPVGSGISAEMKERLRAKLGDIRSKVQHTGGDQGEEEMDEEEDVPVVGSSSSDYSDSAPTAASHPPPMTTGTAIVPATGVPAIAEASHKKRKDRVVEATKGTTTRSLSSQLIARAVATTEKRKAAKRKKKKKKSKNNELVSIAWQDPYGEEGLQREEGEEEKEEKETESSEGWSDCELQFELIRRIKRPRTFQRKRSRPRSTNASKEQGSSGERAVDVDGACSRRDGPVSSDGCTDRFTSGDNGHQGGELLRSSCQTAFPRISTRASGDVHTGSHLGSTSSRGCRESGGLLGGQI